MTTIVARLTTIAAQLIGALALLAQLVTLAGMALLVRGAAEPRRGGPGPEVTDPIPWAIPLAIALGFAFLAAIWSRTGARVAGLISTIAYGVGLSGALPPSVGTGIAVLGAVSGGAWAVQEIAASGGAELRGRPRRFIGTISFVVALTGFVGIPLLLTSPSAAA
jgi:hypothetical protein